RQTASLSQGFDAIAPAGENLVWIGLMPNIPDQLVVRGVEHVVQGDGEFHHAESSTEMPTSRCDRVDGLGPQFICNPMQVLFIESTKIPGVRNAVQDRHGCGIAVVRHLDSLSASEESRDCRCYGPEPSAMITVPNAESYG